jgi:hypothetical protein
MPRLLVFTLKSKTCSESSNFFADAVSACTGGLGPSGFSCISIPLAAGNSQKSVPTRKRRLHSGSDEWKIRTFIERIQNTQMDAGEETRRNPCLRAIMCASTLPMTVRHIPENQLPHLFDPFSAGHGPLSRRRHASGGVYGMVRQGGGFHFQPARRRHNGFFPYICLCNARN